jgi:hypothetical protein
VPAAIWPRSSEYLRLGVRSIERTRWRFWLALRMLSRAPSLMFWAMLVGAKRLLVEGDLAREGIIELVLRFLTLCERAMEDLVGVVSRDARRGSAVWEVILRAGVGAETFAAPSRDMGRVVAASSASVRLTRFAAGLPVVEGLVNPLVSVHGKVHTITGGGKPLTGRRDEADSGM